MRRHAAEADRYFQKYDAGDGTARDREAEVEDGTREDRYTGVGMSPFLSPLPLWKGVMR